MKKFILLLSGVAAVALAVSCHRNPAIQATPAPSVATMEPAPPVPPAPGNPAAMEGPKPGSGAPGMMNPDLAAGRMIYNGKCIKCHEAKPVENWTEAQWAPILKSMVKKARLDSLETSQVTLYVNMNAKKG